MTDLPAAVLARVADLCAQHALSACCEAQLRSLLSALAADASAPTAVRDPALAVDIHVADALAALVYDEVSSAHAIVDIGAGAGFPGIVLAAALPGSSVTLLDSTRRKCESAAALAAAAGIANAGAVCERAESWRDGFGAHDLATARAVGPSATVLEYAAPLLRLGGTLVEWRGAREPEAERAADEAGDQLGLVLDDVRRVDPFPGATEHHLHVWRKDRETPARFPRRVGVARKRPLAG